MRIKTIKYLRSKKKNDAEVFVLDDDDDDERYLNIGDRLVVYLIPFFLLLSRSFFMCD